VVVEIETPHGLARAHLRLQAGSRAALVLGHGAGGGVGAPDLAAASRAGAALGLSVVLVEQPYRVAGRRSPAPAAQLDVAWTAVVARLLARELEGQLHVAGGRSSGARVACRTASATGAVGVLCLAFPLQPRRLTGTAPSRIDELEAVTVPVLVVQGERDPFGMPQPAPGRTVVSVAGDHGLKADLPAVAAAVEGWLPTVVRY
jgi:predicted alpha/beta-hydrolase family hydrolase